MEWNLKGTWGLQYLSEPPALVDEDDDDGDDDGEGDGGEQEADHEADDPGEAADEVSKHGDGARLHEAGYEGGLGDHHPQRPQLVWV
jgi:hypothetical protein